MKLGALIGGWRDLARHHPFVRAVGVLAGGTALAQGLMVVFLPVITRLYSPADFSVLAVYMSLLGIIAIAASLRLDIAIPLPESDEDGVNLLALSLLLSLLLSIGVAALLYAFQTPFIRLVGQPALQPYLWVIPLGVWLSSSYSALQNWTARKKRFATVARTKVSQVASGVFVQIAMGLAGIAPLGLLLGNMLNGGAGNVGLARSFAKEDRKYCRAVSWARMKAVFLQYDRFPKYSTFEALANTAGIQIPILIIASLAISHEAGYLMLATRVIGVPLTLIGTAVSQVYLSHAAEEYRKGMLDVFTLNTLGGLLKTGAGPLIFAGIVAPSVFSLVFGSDWYRAGLLVAWLTPWYVLQFLASPVSMSLHVTNNQRSAMILQFSGLIGRTGCVLAAAYFSRDVLGEVYALSGFVFYALYLFVIAKKLSIKFSTLSRLFLRAAPLLLAWAALGVAVVALGKIALA